MMFFLSDEMPFSFDELLLFGAASGGKAIEDTATGNPLTFLTDLARPLKSLLIPFTPKQEGSGDPSPSNIRPIVPWDGLKVKHGGKNLLNITSDNIMYRTGFSGGNTFTIIDSNNISFHIERQDNCFLLIKVLEIESGIVGSKFLTNKGAIALCDSEGGNRSLKASPYTIQASDVGKILCVRFYNDVVSDYTLNDVQCEVGTTATAYEPYVPITETDISFPSPVYGGTLDAVTGVLTVKYAKLAVKKTQFGNKNTGAVDYRQAVVSTDLINIDDASSWGLARARQNFNLGLIANPYSESSFGNYIGVTYSINNRSITMRISEDIYQAMTDDDSAEIVYRLATPQEIQLTPTQIKALIGNNTIWSDADGQLTAVYLKKG